MRFLEADATERLDFPDASFDLVNARLVNAFLSRQDWPRLIQEGFRLLRPGGILLTCSCSGVIGLDDLLGTLSQVAQRLQRPVQLLETYTHGVDHPINLAMPETSYLKAVFCRVG